MDVFKRTLASTTAALTTSGMLLAASPGAALACSTTSLTDMSCGPNALSSPTSPYSMSNPGNPMSPMNPGGPTSPLNPYNPASPNYVNRNPYGGGGLGVLLPGAFAGAPAAEPVPVDDAPEDVPIVRHHRHHRHYHRRYVE